MSPSWGVKGAGTAENTAWGHLPDFCPQFKPQVHLFMDSAPGLPGHVTIGTRSVSNRQQGDIRLPGSLGAGHRAGPQQTVLSERVTGQARDPILVTPPDLSRP